MLPNFPSLHPASELGKSITNFRGLGLVKCVENQLHPEAMAYEVTERFSYIVEYPKLTQARDDCSLDKGTSYLLRQTAATYEHTFLPYHNGDTSFVHEFAVIQCPAIRSRVLYDFHYSL